VKKNLPNFRQAGKIIEVASLTTEATQSPPSPKDHGFEQEEKNEVVGGNYCYISSHLD